MAENGSGGIPLEGRTEAYATELWLEGPSAFWLHPEGPLSETTPTEWLEKCEAEKAARAEAARNAYNPYANAYSQMAFNQAALMQNQLAYAYHQQSLANQNPLISQGLSQLFGGLL